jgi:hypothetical protein
MSQTFNNSSITSSTSSRDSSMEIASNRREKKVKKGGYVLVCGSVKRRFATLEERAEAYRNITTRRFPNGGFPESLRA